MKIRSTLPILFSFFLIVACKNEENRDETRENLEEQKDYQSDGSTSIEKGTSPATQDQNPGAAGENSSPDDSGNNDNRLKKTSSNNPQLFEGKYIKDGESDISCNCYCVELNLTGTTELCLKEGTIFVTAKMSRGENGMVNIFLVGPAERNSEGDDIPWDDFDRNLPIANITPSQNGKIELDWLGFTINGDLAMDYAIYGKKTLEGQYKKN